MRIGFGLPSANLRSAARRKFSGVAFIDNSFQCGIGQGIPPGPKGDNRSLYVECPLPISESAGRCRFSSTTSDILRILQPPPARKRPALDDIAVNSSTKDRRVTPDRPSDPSGAVLLIAAISIGLVYGGVSSVVPSLVAIFVYGASIRLGGGEYTVSRLFATALFVRNAALVAVSALAGGRNLPIFPDEAQYVKLSLEASNLLFGRNYAAPPEILAMAGPDGIRRFSDDGFAYLLSPLAALHGPSGTLVAIRCSVALIGALGVCATWWAGSKIVGRRAARRAAMAYAIFPTSVFWSATALKESAAAALVLAGFALVARIASSKTVKRALAWSALLWVMWFALVSIREHLAFVAGVLTPPAAAVVAWPFSRGSGPRRVAWCAARAAVLWVAASTVFWASGYGVLGKDVIRSVSPRFLVERAEMESKGGTTIAPETPANDGKTDTGAEQDGSSVIRLARRLPESAFSILSRPFPWEVPAGSLRRFAGPARLFIFPSQVVWYAAILWAVPGAWRFLRRNPRHATLLIGFPFVVLFFYGLTQANLGTAFRLRDVLVPFVLMAAGVPLRRIVAKKASSIAFVLPTLGPGGTENHVPVLARSAAHLGRKSSLVVLKNPEKSERQASDGMASEVRLITGNRRSRYDLTLPIRLAKAIAHVDCCSTYLFAGNFWGGLASRIRHTALISNIRTTHPRGVFQRALEPLTVGELVVCNSNAVAIAARKRGIPPDRIRVVRNGIDPEALRGAISKDRLRVREEIGIPEDAFLACLPGRFDPLKDQMTAVSAFKTPLLANRKDIYLVLAGSSRLPAEKSYRAIVEAAAEDLENVVLVDFYQPIAELLSASDVVVLSSIHEGLPNVLLEAGALGIPQIATTAGGCVEVVEAGKTGLLVPPRNPQSLAEAIVKLADDPVLRKEMGARARRRVETDFSIESETKAFLDLADEAMKKAAAWDAPDVYGSER